MWTKQSQLIATTIPVQSLVSFTKISTELPLTTYCLACLCIKKKIFLQRISMVLCAGNPIQSVCVCLLYLKTAKTEINIQTKTNFSSRTQFCVNNTFCINLWLLYAISIFDIVWCDLVSIAMRFTLTNYRQVSGKNLIFQVGIIVMS